MTTIYLDMDGVLADWNSGVEKLIGYRLDEPGTLYPMVDWEKIRNAKRIFRHLAKMPQADELVSIARRFRDELGYELLILTAVPHYNDVHWAFWDKVMWAQERYPDIPVHFGPYSEDKQKHCIPGDILVDDRYDNGQRWTAAGGVFVKVNKNYQEMLDKLQDMFDAALPVV